MDDSTERLLELLAREGPSLLALLTRLTLNGHAAEDLIQELFVKICQSDAFYSARNPAAYLRRTAIHLAFAWRRRLRRAADTAVNIGEIEVIDHGPRAEVLAIQREDWQRILDAAGELTGLARDVFVLQYLQRQTVEEIAEQIERTPHQVRALASKAVAAVRNRIAEVPQRQEDAHVRQ